MITKYYDLSNNYTYQYYFFFKSDYTQKQKFSL